MPPLDFTRWALLWGPGVLVLVVFSYALVRLAYHWIDKSVEVKRQQTESLFEVARTYLQQLVSAQKSQADAFSRLASTVEHRDSHDGLEHQEMLIALKAMRETLDSVVEGRRDL